MSRKLYDIAIPVSEYVTKTGEKKTQWKKVGSVINGDKGPFITMDAFFNPAAMVRDPSKDNVILGLYKPRDENDNQENKLDHNQTNNKNGFDDEVPF